MAIYLAHGFLFDKGEKRTFPTPRGEFKVRSFKLEIKEQGSNGQMYSTIPEFTAMNEVADMFDYDSVYIGMPMEVSFAVQGREMKWNDKTTGEPKSAWRTEVKAIKVGNWKQEGMPMQVQPPAAAPAPQPVPQPQPTFAPPAPLVTGPDAWKQLQASQGITAPPPQPQAQPPQQQGGFPTQQPEPSLAPGDVDFSKDDHNSPLPF